MNIDKIIEDIKSSWAVNEPDPTPDYTLTNAESARQDIIALLNIIAKFKKMGNETYISHCPRPHCGGLLLAETFTTQTGTFEQRKCALCNRTAEKPKMIYDPGRGEEIPSKPISPDKNVKDRPWRGKPRRQGGYSKGNLLQEKGYTEEEIKQILTTFSAEEFACKFRQTTQNYYFLRRKYLGRIYRERKQ